VARDWNIYGEGEVKFKKGRNEVDRTVAGRMTSDVTRQKIFTIVDCKTVEATLVYRKMRGGALWRIFSC
jgi:hypothetical protein